jgi:chaperonin GroEL
MEKAAAAVVEEIARRSRRVRGTDDITAVAVLAANNDEVLGRLIAQAMERVGPDGVITVLEGKGLLTTLEVVEGTQFDQGYLSSYFVTDPERMVADLEKPFILLHDKKISTLAELQPLLEQILGRRRPLLVVAEDVDGEALATLVVNRLRGSLEVVAVKAPGYGDGRRALLEDLAVLTGGVVVSEETGRTLETVELADLGQADRVVVENGETTVVGGHGKKSAVAARIELLRRGIAEASSDYDREKLEERLAKLVGGVGVIRIGAATVVEMHETKARAEDALAATRAAVAEGILIGGGAVLLRAATAVDALSLSGPEEIGARVLRKALAAPLIQIVENAGFSGAVIAEAVRTASGPTLGFNALTGKVEDLAGAGVWGPAKVVRSALQNAVSIAGLVLTTETLVVEVPDEPDPEAEA